MISLAYKISHCLSANHYQELRCVICTGQLLTSEEKNKYEGKRVKVTFAINNPSVASGSFKTGAETRFFEKFMAPFIHLPPVTSLSCRRKQGRESDRGAQNVVTRS